MLRAVYLAVAFVLMFTATSFAQDQDVENLKRRVDELEKKVGDGKVVSEEQAHKRVHPVHSIYGLTFSGSITTSAHGVKLESGNEPSAEAAFSADLVVESPVGENGRAVVVLDFQRGIGMQGLSFATAPNGAATGYNADIEGFDDTNIHVAQAYYEHKANERLVLSVGQLDITGYFDANEFANDERAQFMAPVFVNSPVIEFGGSADFYSFGLAATCTPAENISVTLGAFEGDGNYSETFDKPFLMAEVDYAAKLFGRDGNYRLYYWYRGARPDEDPSTTALEAENLAAKDTAMLDDFNNGVGVSIDQMVTDAVGVWIRAGIQREEIAQFDKFIGAGVHLSGELFGRANDQMGVGYGASFMSQKHEDSQAAGFEAAPEHYFELYYNYAVAHSGPDEGFHISPDFQYVVNPGGNDNADSAFIYGIRLQTYF